MKEAGSIAWQTDGQVFWVVLLVSLVLLAFLGWQNWKRTNKKYLWMRLLASLGLVASLVLIGLKPAWNTASNTQTAILLTDNYLQPVVDSLRKAEDSVLVFRYAGTTSPKKLENTEVPDAAFIQRNYPSLGKVHIVGNGIPAHQLPLFKQYQTHFYLNNLPAGFQEVSYPKQTVAQERFTVKGSYRNLADTSVRMLLTSPGGAVDSVLINGKQTEAFSLGDKPKEAGKYVYRLLVKNPKGDTLSHELLPINIDPKRKLHVVIINNFPRFETKYLKNWLAEKGHAVAVRSVISKNKVKDEFANQTAINFRLSAQLLKQTDLLILDAEYAQGLGAGTLATLQQVIKEQGLGVLIQADESGGVPVTLARFPLGRIDRDKVRISGNDFGIKGNFELAQLPYLLQQKLGTLALVRSTQGQTLVGYNIKGLGTVGISLVEESYQMLLDGKPKYYAAYWSHILNKLAKKQRPASFWQVNTLFPMVNNACELTLNTGLIKPIGELINKSGVSEFYLQNQFGFPQKWNGLVWAHRAGWHQLVVKGDTTSRTPLYIFAEQDWKNWRITQRIEANQQWAKANKPAIKTSKKTTLFYQTPIPLWHFFVVFLLSAGFLWLEPKL